MEPEQGAAERRLRLLYLTLCLGYLAWGLWLMVPEHRRVSLRLRLLRSSARVTNRIARHAGAASMGRELATGEQRYEVPLRLSLWRARLERAYGRAGPGA